MLAVPPPPPTVMIVGHGFIGKAHAQKAEKLAKLTSVVDTDPTRLQGLNVPTYASVEEAFASTLPDIIAVCANTQTHFEILKQIKQLSLTYGKCPHLLIEKPLVSTAEKAEAIRQLYLGYEGKISSGYLFRQAPVVDAGLNYLKEKELTIQSVDTLWQKDRIGNDKAKNVRSRPSEGVHIDEATHPIDLTCNYILPQAGVDVNGVTIVGSSFKRQSVAGQIVDQERQNELYQDEPDKLDPIAEVKYMLNAGGILISGSSSFVKGPQRREITLTCDQGTTLFFEFDVQGADRVYTIVDGEKALLLESKADKLLLEWQDFLKYCETGVASPKIQTWDDMIFDIKLTELLGQEGLTFPCQVR